MIRLRPADRRAGAAMFEYVILLMAVAIFLITVVVEYGNAVEDEWAQTDENPAWDSISENLAGGATADGADSPCPYYYNAATGRWHDPATHLFVSFDDAGGAGCS